MWFLFASLMIGDVNSSYAYCHLCVLFRVKPGGAQSVPHRPASCGSLLSGPSPRGTSRCSVRGPSLLLEPCVPPPMGPWTVCPSGECWSLREQAWACGQWEGGLYKGWAPSQPVNKHLTPCSEPGSPTHQPSPTSQGHEGRTQTPGPQIHRVGLPEEQRVMHSLYRLQENTAHCCVLDKLPPKTLPSQPHREKSREHRAGEGWVGRTVTPEQNSLGAGGECPPLSTPGN